LRDLVTEAIEHAKEHFKDDADSMKHSALSYLGSEIVHLRYKGFNLATYHESGRLKVYKIVPWTKIADMSDDDWLGDKGRAFIKKLEEKKEPDITLEAKEDDSDGEDKIDEDAEDILELGEDVREDFLL